MRYRELGRSELEDSEVSLGLWADGGDAWGPAQDEESLAAMRTARDAGVNISKPRTSTDAATARSCSAVPDRRPARERLRRDEVGLWHGRQPNPYRDEQMIMGDCEASLRRLGVVYIDVYQDHVWWDENAEVFAGALQRLKEQEKVRLTGLSANNHDYVRHFEAAVGGMDTLQLDHSNLKREPEELTLPFCEERGVGVIVRGPLEMGELTGKFTADTTFEDGDIRKDWTEGDSRAGYLRDLAPVESLSFLAEGRTMAPAALAYVLAHPAVSATIPGAKRLNQVEDNVAAARHQITDDEPSSVREALSDASTET